MIDLPLCTPEGAAHASRVARHFPLAFEVAGRPVVASLSRRAGPSEWRRLDARLQGQRLSLAVDPSLLPPEALSLWPDLIGLRGDDALREILFDIVLLEVSREIEAWCGERPVWSPASDETARPHQVSISRADEMFGVIGLDDDGLAWLAARCATLPVRHATLDALPARVDLRLPDIAMRPAEMRGLAHGDAVLLDDAPVAADGSMTVALAVGGARRFRAIITQGRMTLDSAMDSPMDHPDPLAPPSLDDLALPVEVSAGRITMPLARLRELAVGQVLDLGFDATVNVSLSVNGQVIATGELVRIADRTGVRILDLRLARDPVS